MSFFSIVPSGRTPDDDPAVSVGLDVMPCDAELILEQRPTGVPGSCGRDRLMDVAVGEPLLTQPVDDDRLGDVKERMAGRPSYTLWRIRP
jgi:hypothetical protein